MAIAIPNNLKGLPLPTNADIIVMRELKDKGKTTEEIFAALYGGTARMDANIDLLDFILDNNILTDAAIDEAEAEPEPEPEPEE